jgi:hypothetical protein
MEWPFSPREPSRSPAPRQYRSQPCEIQEISQHPRDEPHLRKRHHPGARWYRGSSIQLRPFSQGTAGEVNHKEREAQSAGDSGHLPDSLHVGAWALGHGSGRAVSWMMDSIPNRRSSAGDIRRSRWARGGHGCSVEQRGRRSPSSPRCAQTRSAPRLRRMLAKLWRGPCGVRLRFRSSALRTIGVKVRLQK